MAEPDAAGGGPEMPATGNESAGLSVARVFTQHTAPVNSLDFTKDGERLLSSGDDHRICLYSTTQGQLERIAQCNAHGATLARFTHDPLSIVVASPMDHAVRYMSLHDNRYLRTYRAHTDRVVALEMSPKEDILASASMDDTARLWDLRTTNCQGVMRFQGGGHRPAVAFDPGGLVFAAAICGGRVKLFDVRGYDKGPFLTFLTQDLGGNHSFSGIKFSNDGTFMLLTTTNGVHMLLDAFNGTVIRTFSGHAPSQQSGAGAPPGGGQVHEACFSPDSDLVLSGGEDGGIWRYDTRTGSMMPVLREHHAPVGHIKCNPVRLMIASADTATCLWLPD